jgi:hypothetical protein
MTGRSYTKQQNYCLYACAVGAPSSLYSQKEFHIKNEIIIYGLFCFYYHLNEFEVVESMGDGWMVSLSCKTVPKLLRNKIGTNFQRLMAYNSLVLILELHILCACPTYDDISVVGIFCIFMQWHFDISLQTEDPALWCLEDNPWGKKKPDEVPFWSGLLYFGLHSKPLMEPEGTFQVPYIWILCLCTEYPKNDLQAQLRCFMMLAYIESQQLDSAWTWKQEGNTKHPEAWQITRQQIHNQLQATVV